MTVKLNVCPHCFAVSPRDLAIALGQASRCPHCGESAVMDPADEINQHPPVPRQMSPDPATARETTGPNVPRTPGGRTPSGPIGQFFCGMLACIGLLLCVASGCAAVVLVYLEFFQTGAYAFRSDVFPVEFFVKAMYCAAVFVIAVVGLALNSVFGLACRRWPRSLLRFGIFPAVLGVAPLIIMILWFVGILLFAYLEIQFSK